VGAVRAGSRPLTWRDEAAPWPSALLEDRCQVAEPDSVGVTVRKQRAEGQLVIFHGGWADLVYWGGASDELLLETPGWDDWLDLSGVERLLRRFAGLFG
jgi:hypothetical protein